MKKLFLFIAILIISVSVNAQLKSSSLQLNGGTKLTGDKAATDDFYTKTQVDGLVYKQEIQNTVNNASGIDYRFPVLSNTLNSAGAAMVDGRRYFVRVDLKSNYTTGNVCFATTGTTADYTQTTAGEKNAIYLYSWSAGTLTAIDSTSNNRDLWKTSASVLTSKAWKGGSHTLAAGTYYIGFIWTATTTTTAPTLQTVGAITTGYQSMFFPTNGFATCFQNTQTAMPSSVDISGFSGSTSQYFMILKP